MKKKNPNIFNILMTFLTILESIAFAIVCYANNGEGGADSYVVILIILMALALLMGLISTIVSIVGGLTNIENTTKSTLPCQWILTFWGIAKNSLTTIVLLFSVLMVVSPLLVIVPFVAAFIIIRFCYVGTIFAFSAVPNVCYIANKFRKQEWKIDGKGIFIIVSQFFPILNIIGTSMLKTLIKIDEENLEKQTIDFTNENN